MTDGPSRYADEVGVEALDRQAAEAAARFPCCGERREDGHHLMCRMRPDEVPPPIDGQESLL